MMISHAVLLIRRGVFLRSFVTTFVCVGALACASDPDAAPVDGFEGTIPTSAMTLFERDSLLHDVKDLSVGSDGTVWVLSQNAPHLRRLTPDGLLLERFGPNGPGPGEMRAPISVDASADGSALVYDAGLRKLVAFAADGQVVEEVSVDIGESGLVRDYGLMHTGQPFRIHEVEGSIVMEISNRLISDPSRTWDGRLALVEADGSTDSTLVDFTTLHPTGAVPPFGIHSPWPLWDRCSDGSIQVLEPFAQRLLSVHAGGARSEGILDLPRTSITEEMYRTVIDAAAEMEGMDRNDPQVAELMEETLIELLEEAPEFAPYTRLRCDAGDRIWLQLFSVEWDVRGYGPSWIVWTDTGPRSVTFPRGFLPDVILADRIYGTYTDELGIESVAWTGNPIR